MIREAHLEKRLPFGTLRLDLRPVGEDVLAVVSGGDAPHLGCAVLAAPRPSLAGDGSTSCTSSVLNLTGHKDEALCRAAAEALCRRYGVTVVCTGGFHKDNIGPAEIRAVSDALEALLSSCTA